MIHCQDFLEEIDFVTNQMIRNPFLEGLMKVLVVVLVGLVGLGDLEGLLEVLDSSN